MCGKNDNTVGLELYRQQQVRSEDTIHDTRFISYIAIQFIVSIYCMFPLVA